VKRAISIANKALLNVKAVTKEAVVADLACSVVDLNILVNFRENKGEKGIHGWKSDDKGEANASSESF
jgi:hypothetical protein